LNKLRLFGKIKVENVLIKKLMD